jgi:hypothetical protein
MNISYNYKTFKADILFRSRKVKSYVHQKIIRDLNEIIYF